MNTPVRILILAALAVVVAVAVVLKPRQSPDEPAAVSAIAAANLPKLLDLGADKCVPCKMMKPILDDLKANYADRFITEFIDVWKNPAAGKQHGVEIIPTQILDRKSVV